MPEMTRRHLLASAGTAAAAAFAAEFLPSNVRRALAAGPPSGKGSLNDIKHVVILMQENRSFDHYFGTLPGVRGFADPTAITEGTAALAAHASESWIFSLTQRTEMSASRAIMMPIDSAQSVSKAECGMTRSKMRPE